MTLAASGSGRGVLYVALLFSSLVHLGLAGWYLKRLQDAPPVQELTSRSFDLTLLAPEPPVAVPEDTRVVPDEMLRPPTQNLPSESIPETLVAAPAMAAEQPVAAPRPTLPSLNLQRPSNWDALALDPPEQTGALVFKRSASEALSRRRKEQEASQALSRAQVARLGLPEEQFRRRTDEGEEVKTEKGCFVKRIEQGPSGQQERWWRKRCNDSRQPAWRRELLSFGPDHRLETAEDGKSDCPNGRCWAY